MSSSPAGPPAAAPGAWTGAGLRCHVPRGRPPFPRGTRYLFHCIVHLLQFLVTISGFPEGLQHDFLHHREELGETNGSRSIVLGTTESVWEPRGQGTTQQVFSQPLGHPCRGVPSDPGSEAVWSVAPGDSQARHLPTHLLVPLCFSPLTLDGPALHPPVLHPPVPECLSSRRQPDLQSPDSPVAEEPDRFCGVASAILPSPPRGTLCMQLSAP